MSKYETIEKVENYLESSGIHTVKNIENYATIGFDMREVEASDQREIVQALLKIAPTYEFVHKWNFIYQITHIDDAQWPAKTILKI